MTTSNPQAEVEPVDLIQTNGQVQRRSYQYKVKLSSGEHHKITVIATNNSSAREVILQQFAHGSPTLEYLGCTDIIMQVN